MKSLKNMIMVLILFLTVISGAMYFSQAIIQSKKAVKLTLEGDLTTVSRQVANEVELEIQKKFDMMKAIGSTRLFQDAEESLDSKQDQLDTITHLDKSLIGINIMDLQGNLRVEGAGYLNFCNDPYFTEPIAGRNNVFGPIVNEVTNEMTIFYGSPIKDSSGRVINTLLIAANGDILCSICENLKIGKTGHAMIIDRENGVVVGDKNKSLVTNGTNIRKEYYKNPDYKNFDTIIDDILNGNQGGGYYEYKGIKRIAYYTPVNGTSYTAVVIAEYSEYYAHLQDLRNTVFAVAVLALVFGIIIALVVGNSLKPLNTLGDAINEIATGNADLTRRLELKRTKKEIAYVVQGFNQFVTKLQEIVSSIKRSEDQLASIDENLQTSTVGTTKNIADINSSIQDVIAQIKDQTDSVQGTASAVNEIASNIESLEKMIENQSSGVSQASSAVEQMVGNINAVNSSVEKMVYSFRELEENTTAGIMTQQDVNSRIQQIEDQSKMLQEANSAIANIAEQTNLLAMNAAIEAAHAGESGKGFSVVADEIRKLSETSSEQSRRIGDELKKIQDSIAEVVIASSKSITAFTTVSTNIKSTDQLVRQIKGAMEEQQIGSRQITDALTAMNDSTSEVKSAAAEMTEGNKLILREVEILQNATATMRQSIGNVTESTERISESGETLSDISSKVTESITQIGTEINQFKV